MQPTPRRPRTATRSGAAARSAIAVSRPSARRGGKSRQLPDERLVALSTMHRMVAPASPRREPPLSGTSRRQLLGINLDHGRLHRRFMGHHGRMHAQPGVRARPDTPVAEQSETAKRPAGRLPASQLPLPTFRPSELPSGQPGSGCGRNWVSPGTPEPAGEPLDTARVVRPRGAGGARDRLRQRHVDAGDGAGRAGHRRDRGGNLPAGAGAAAVRDRARTGAATSG